MLGDRTSLQSLLCSCPFPSLKLENLNGFPDSYNHLIVVLWSCPSKYIDRKLWYVFPMVYALEKKGTQNVIEKLGTEFLKTMLGDWNNLWEKLALNCVQPVDRL